MIQAGALGRGRQRALDHAMNIGGTHHWLADFTVERVTVCALGQANGFEVAELAVQAGQLTVLVELDLQHLAVFELAELLGLLVAGQHFMHGGSRQADLGEQGRQGIATAHGNFAVAWVLAGWRSFGSGRRRLDLGGFGRCGAVVDLRKRRGRGVSVLGKWGVLFLLELLGRAFQLQVQGGFLGFDLAGWEHQQGQAE
ncbi:hypothetical protein D3C80_1466130 [compost metagenome]